MGAGPDFIIYENGEPDHEGRLPTRGAHLRAFRDHWPEGIRLPGFDDFGLCSPILHALTTEGYIIPTSIQSRIPTTRKPSLFRSWLARTPGIDHLLGEVTQDFDFRLRHVARAISAAPSYFSPSRIQNGSSKWFSAVDGGVFANNPSVITLVAAYKLYPEAESFMVVSLGSGSLAKPIPYGRARRWGSVGRVQPVLSILMDGNADTIHDVVNQILGTECHFRFQISTGLDFGLPYTMNEAFDCATAENIARLERLANRLIEDEREKLNNVVELLQLEKWKPDK